MLKKNIDLTDFELLAGGSRVDLDNDCLLVLEPAARFRLTSSLPVETKFLVETHSGDSVIELGCGQRILRPTLTAGDMEEGMFIENSSPSRIARVSFRIVKDWVDA